MMYRLSVLKSCMSDGRKILAPVNTFGKACKREIEEKQCYKSFMSLFTPLYSQQNNHENII